MKSIISIFFSIVLLACQSDKKKPSETLEVNNLATDLYEPLESEASSVDQNYQAALDFLNSYIENNQTLGVLEFVKASPFATESFKTELENIVIRAWEENPKIGLQFDPLFDAQDYPHKGVALVDFNSDTGYVTVKGIAWDDFRVVLKVVDEDGHILVDGCGMVKIPEDKRAER